MANDTPDTVDTLQALMRLEQKFNEKAKDHANTAEATHAAADKIRELGLGKPGTVDTLQGLMRLEKKFNGKAVECENITEDVRAAADLIRALVEENRALKKDTKTRYI